MKKIILSIMAVAAISFTSCGNKADNGSDAEAVQSDVETLAESEEGAVASVESVISDLTAKLDAGDKAAVESTVGEAKAQIATLVEQGKTEEAKAYAEKIQNFVKENKEKLTATGSALISSFVSSTENLNLDNIETTAKDWASAVKSVTEGSGEQVVSDVKETAKTLAGDAANKVDEAKSKVEDAKSKVDEVKSKVDAAKSKVDEVKNKVDEAKSKVDNAPESAKKAVEDMKNKTREDLKNKANEEVNKGLNKLFGK